LRVYAGPIVAGGARRFHPWLGDTVVYTNLLEAETQRLIAEGYDPAVARERAVLNLAAQRVVQNPTGTMPAPSYLFPPEPGRVVLGFPESETPVAARWGPDSGLPGDPSRALDVEAKRRADLDRRTLLEKWQDWWRCSDATTPWWMPVPDEAARAACYTRNAVIIGVAIGATAFAMYLMKTIAPE
jgi:hypothetical protein